jgi:hypothetical protein
LVYESTEIDSRGGESIGERGHNKDHRPDLYQMVVGMALDVEGQLICCKMWPGNTADVKTLLPMIKRMREVFGCERSRWLVSPNLLGITVNSTLGTKNSAKVFSFVTTRSDFLIVAVVPALLATESSALGD